MPEKQLQIHSLLHPVISIPPDSERWYQYLFYNNPLPTWIVDKEDLRFLEVNQAAEHLYGYSKEEFLELSIFNLRDEKEHQQIRAKLNSPEFFQLAEGVRKHITKHGTEIWVKVEFHDIMYSGKNCVLVIVQVVTDRLEAERKLIESGLTYKSLFENSPLYTWVCDPYTLRILEVNKTAIKGYGYSKKEFLDMTAFDIMHPEERDQQQQIVSQAEIRIGKRFHFVLRHLKKGGELIYVNLQIHIILYKGTLAGLVMALDVTEKVLARKKLEEEEEFYRTILENNADIQLVTDELGIVRFASPSVFRIFGFTRDQILGKQRKDFWHPEDAKTYKEKVQDLIENPGKTISLEIRCLNSKMEYVWCQARISNQTQNPVIRGYVSNYTSIHKRKLAEEKIRASEKLYRLLFNTGCPKWLLDKSSFRIMEANQAAIDLYGYTQEEFLQMTPFDLRIPESKKELKCMIEDGSFEKMRGHIVQHIKKNGEVLTMQMSSHVLLVDGKEAILGIAVDISDLLKLQKALTEEQVNKQVEITRAMINGQEKERNELGKELHDNINQLLATAKLYLDTSLDKQSSRPEMLKIARDLVKDSIQEIRRLSKSLVPPSLGDLTLREALKDLLPPLRLRKKKVSLVIRGLNESSLCGDIKISIYRMAQEQLNNIMKYAEASEIRIVLVQTGQKLKLEISDDGKGFDTSKRRAGIGITNIMNRAATFNGAVVIDSAPGKGCHLYVSFDLRNKETILHQPTLF